MPNTIRTRATQFTWLTRTLVRSGFLGTVRLDRYARMGVNLRRHGGPSPVSGIGLAAARPTRHRHHRRRRTAHLVAARRQRPLRRIGRSHRRDAGPAGQDRRSCAAIIAASSNL